MEHFNVLSTVVVRAITIFSLEDILTVKMLVDSKEKPYQRYHNFFFVQVLVPSIDNYLICQYWDRK